jgi:catechol 2,3-dioxygenase-like lactoylglutathione lyase family enzyme
MSKKNLYTNQLKFMLKLLPLLTAMTSLPPLQAYEIDPDSTIYDSPTTLLGINHIGLSVRDLDTVLEFYQSVSNFKLVSRETVSNNSNADKLFGHNNIELEVAVLEAPNMLFEITEFKHNRNKPVRKMLVQGPGMTHTCFQTPAALSGYDRFKGIGAEILSRGETAVDLGGYGVTYAYAYDPEGNMFELEQLDSGPLSEVPNKVKWVERGMDMWMTQVALVTHDLERLTNYYAKILAFEPYREGDYVNHPRMVEIADADNLSLLVTWFRMNGHSKTLEFWEYRNPLTIERMGKLDSTELGYSYSIEVGDIQAEYQRMVGLGVEFISTPVQLGEFWQVYANDIDGNVFSLRQAVDTNSPYSIPQLEL